MKAIKLSLLVGALLATSGVAMAQPGQAGFEGGRRAAVEMTRDQALARADQAFARLDLNNDGRVTTDEARQARQTRAGERQARRGDRRGPGQRPAQGQMFERLDANHDGMLSREEFDARRAQRAERGARGERGEPMGQRMGMRGGRGGGERAMAMFGPDGVITREEFRARALQRFERMDVNRDGRISADERQQVRQRMMQERQERRMAPSQN